MFTLVRFVISFAFCLHSTLFGCACPSLIVCAFSFTVFRLHVLRIQALVFSVTYAYTHTYSTHFSQLRHPLVVGFRGLFSFQAVAISCLLAFSFFSLSRSLTHPSSSLVVVMCFFACSTATSFLLLLIRHDVFSTIVLFKAFEHIPRHASAAVAENAKHVLMFASVVLSLAVYVCERGAIILRVSACVCLYKTLFIFGAKVFNQKIKFV